MFQTLNIETYDNCGYTFKNIITYSSVHCIHIVIKSANRQEFYFCRCFILFDYFDHFNVCHDGRQHTYFEYFDKRILSVPSTFFLFVHADFSS